MTRYMKKDWNPGKKDTMVLVDTHWHSQWHFTSQASLDLNPDVFAILYTS